MNYNIPDALGTELYGVAAASTSQEKPYHYTIYPQTFIIREIRIGRAKMGEEDFHEYGNGEITYLCECIDNGHLIACSPMDGAIIGIKHTASRPKHLYREKKRLLAEAKTLRRCILKNYRHVVDVTIELELKEKGL